MPHHARLGKMSLLFKVSIAISLISYIISVIEHCRSKGFSDTLMERRNVRPLGPATVNFHKEGMTEWQLMRKTRL